METIGFAFVLYVLIGLVRVGHAFTNRNLMSPMYVRRANIFRTLLIALMWPLAPIAEIVEQRRRMTLKYFFDFYLVILFYGLSVFAASLLGFSKICASNAVFYIKVLKIVGITAIYGFIIWWLYNRQRYKFEEYIKPQ